MYIFQNRLQTISRFWIFELWILSFVQLCSSQTSPCPDVFSYQRTTDNTIVGKVVIPAPNYGRHKLEIAMQLKTRLTTTYVGKIKFQDEANLATIFATRSKLNYIILFPVQSPLPNVVSIKFNGAVICAGRKETFSESGEVITSIKLQHTLKADSSLIANQYNRPSSNQNQVLTPYVPPNQSNQVSNNNHNYNQNQNNPNYEIIYSNQPQQQPQYYNNDYGHNQNNQGFQQPTYEVVTRPPPPPPRTTTAPPPSPPRVVQPNFDYDDFSNENSVRCGLKFDPLSTFIYHGEDVSPGDWPWIVAVFEQNRRRVEFICSGTLLSNTLVATAAHCIDTGYKQLEKSKILLRIGAHNIHDWADESESRGVREIVYPDTYVKRQPTVMDAALLVLNRPIKYSQNIIPICLWTGPNVKTGIEGTVVGWGKDEIQNEAVPEPRLTVVPIVSQDECRNSNSIFRTLLNDNMFCAGRRDGSGPCKGDSGGGVYVFRNERFQFKGIVSAGIPLPGTTGTCDLSNFVIYTDAAKLNKWLRFNIEKYRKLD